MNAGIVPETGPRASLLAPPPLPREHGAWAMLAIPLALGLFHAGRPGAAAWLIVPAMLLLFLTRYAAVPAAARVVAGRPLRAGRIVSRILWAGVYVAGSIACLTAALVAMPAGGRRAVLLAAVATAALGGTHTALALAGLDRTLAGEIVGMAGLCAAAPLVISASGGALDAAALGTGLLALTYFASSLAYVRAVRALWRGTRGAAALCLLAHGGLAALLAVLAGTGSVPAAAIAAFIPVLLRTAWGLWRPPRHLRALGWREVAVAVLFCGIAGAALAA